MYRRKTNVDSNSAPFPETKGITRHCQTCKQWKSTGGFRKHLSVDTWNAKIV